jgi:hypothetical protein
MGDWTTDASIPAAVRTALQSFVSTLAGNLGDGLVSVSLGGAVAAGDEYYAKATHVDLLVVVKDPSVATLDGVVPAARAAERAVRLFPMVLSEEDLRSSVDVFPTKFLALQATHRVLHGRDVLAEIEVHRDHLRLRCEQEVKNLMLRLRRAYLRGAGDHAKLLAIFTDANLSFLQILGHVLVCRGEERPATNAAVAERAAAELGLELAVLQEWLAVARGGYSPTPAQAKEMVERLMRDVRAAAAAVDAMDGSGGAGSHS